MGRASVIAIAGAATLLAIPAASAADLAPAMPLPVVQDFSGWYLRGDIGFSNQQVSSLFNVLNNSPGTSVNTVNKSFDSAPFFGLGVGYQFNSWLRADLTGEYRGNANFHGLEIVSFNGAPVSTDQYQASKSEVLFLANVYADLGTWWHITPFIGAGIGTSYNKISSFVDVNTPGLGVAYGADSAKWNFAWAVHAGLAYRVTPAFTVELAYRYLNLGDAQSGDLITYTGVNQVNNPEQFHNLTSHDVKLGVRWMLGEPEPVYAPALMRKG